MQGFIRIFSRGCAKVAKTYLSGTVCLEGIVKRHSLSIYVIKNNARKLDMHIILCYYNNNVFNEYTKNKKYCFHNGVFIGRFPPFCP